MLEIVEISVTPFQQICRLLFAPGEPGAVVVDPGGDSALIVEALEKRALSCSQVWITHSHLDHCGGVAGLRRRFDFLCYAHPSEETMRKSVKSFALMFGVAGAGLEDCPEPDVPLFGGETVSVGTVVFSVIHAPGHSAGHLCFYSDSEKLLLSGDVLFRHSIGRTDLPGGNHGQLMSSIKDTILVLPDETRVLPGHGAPTTIGEERRSNPFLADEV